MSIQVVSTTEPEAKAAVETPAIVEGKEVDTQSAPAEKAEQNESTESDPAETEEREGKADESEEEDSEEGTESKDTDKEKPQKKSGWQRRIDKLNARNTAAQKEAEYWKQLALKQMGADEAKKGEPKNEKPKAADPVGKPSPDAFETHTEYVEALTDWKIEQREKGRKEADAKTQLETEQEKLLKTHSERVKSFAEKTKDFDDVLAEVEDIFVSPAVESIIVSSENGPELMYELAKNREEFERINKLSPLAAAREFGKIEARLAAKTSDAKPAKKITKAPEPIKPVGAKGSAVEKSIYDENLTQAEFERLMAKREAKRTA